MKPAPMPWIGCGAGWPPEMTGEAAGSTANTFSFGHAALSTWAQPVRWPPVPTPGDQRVDAVGESPPGFPAPWCARALRRWPGSRTAAGSSRRASAPAVPRRGRCEPFMPFSRGVRSKRGAVGQHQAAALDRHAVGHDQDDLVALDGRHHGQADAGVARGRLDDGAAGLERAGALGVFDHGQGDAVLDRAAGVAALGLDPDLVAGAEQAVDADVRRAADGLENVGGFHGRSPRLGKGAFWRSPSACAAACWYAPGR